MICVHMCIFMHVCLWYLCMCLYACSCVLYSMCVSVVVVHTHVYRIWVCTHVDVCPCLHASSYVCFVLCMLVCVLHVFSWLLQSVYMCLCTYATTSRQIRCWLQISRTGWKTTFWTCGRICIWSRLLNTHTFACMADLSKCSKVTVIWLFGNLSIYEPLRIWMRLSIQSKQDHTSCISVG